MHVLRRIAFVALIGLLPGLVLSAAAQSPQPPGAGHGFLIDKHVSAGVTCNKCHTESPPAKEPDQATCLTCHGGTYEKLAAMTASQTPNPHDSHQGPVPCASCHHVHKASENFCSSCHNFEMTVP